MTLPFVLPVPVPVGVAAQAHAHARTKHVQAALVLALFALLALASRGTFAPAPGLLRQQQQQPQQQPLAAAAAAATDEGSASDHVRRACRATPLIVDVASVRRRRQQAPTPPRLSLIFITKRPGGYDVLLNSLAQQTVTDWGSYELICVDELAPYRASRVRDMASELGVNLVAIVPSKPKTRANAHLRFGIYNALNTGVLLARGDVVTFVMDLSWLPSNFLERTLAFYADDAHSRSLLAYPERFWHLTQLPSDPSVFSDYHSLSFFPTNLTRSFSQQPELFVPGQLRPEKMVEAFNKGSPRGVEKQPLAEEGGWKFWELSFASCPWSVLERLNGVEEEFDFGDDSHEGNIRIRSEFLGYDLWIDGSVVVDNLWHKNHFQPGGQRWNRFAEDSAMHQVLSQAPQEIRDGRRSLASRGHDFNLTLWRQLDCPVHLD